CRFIPGPPRQHPRNRSAAASVCIGGAGRTRRERQHQMLMTVFSKFHPLLVHFPIALVLTSAVAELVAMTTARQFWRTVAVANIRAGAVMGLVAAITGWLFASLPLMDTSTPLEWHRWLGMSGAAGAIGAAFLSAT